MVPLVIASLAGWLLIASPPAPASSVQALPPSTRAFTFDAAEIAAVVHRAQSPAPPPLPDRLVYRPRLDVPITAAAVAGWVFAEVNKEHLVAVTCNWCDRAPDGSDTLNGVDRWGRRAFLWKHTGRAITLSNITAFGLAPAAAYGLDWAVARSDDRSSDAVADWLLISQSMAIASDVTEAMKFVIGRQRPFVHVLAPGSPALTKESADNNTSFPSGHTTLAFSLATSSWEIATLRGYRRSRWLLRAGIPIAAFTAYFRVAADRHYLTDVFAGAGVGSVVGWGIPYLAHRSSSDRRIPAIALVRTRRGEMLQARWAW